MQGFKASPLEDPGSIQPAPQGRQQPGTVDGQGSRLEPMLGDGLALRRDHAGVVDGVGLQFPVDLHPEVLQGLKTPGQQQKTEALGGGRPQPLTEQRGVSMDLLPAHCKGQPSDPGSDD